MLYLKCVVDKMKTLEAEVLGDGIYFSLQHSGSGVKATWPIT